LYHKNTKKNGRDKNIAKDALNLAIQLKKARNWNNDGFFWVPSDGARDLLAQL